MALICDTGPLYAAMDRSDRDHLTCAKLIETSTEQVLVPAPVVVELDWLAGRRLESEAFLSFLVDVEEARVGVLELRVDELCAHSRASGSIPGSPSGFRGRSGASRRRAARRVQDGDTRSQTFQGRAAKAHPGATSDAMRPPREGPAAGSALAALGDEAKGQGRAAGGDAGAACSRQPCGPGDDALEVPDLHHLQQQGSARSHGLLASEVLPIASKASEDDADPRGAGEHNGAAAEVLGETSIRLRPHLERRGSGAERERQGVLYGCS